MNKFLLRAGVALTTLTLPTVTFAQFGGAPQAINLDRLKQILFPVQPSGNFNIVSFFLNLFNLVILLAAIIAILYLVWAGIQYITASTDEEKAKKARTAIYNAIIGIVVIILSYSIIIWVGGFVQEQAQQVGGNGFGAGFNSNGF